MIDEINDQVIQRFQDSIRSILYNKCLAITRKLDIEKIKEDDHAFYEALRKSLPDSGPFAYLRLFEQTVLGVFVHDTHLVALFKFGEKHFELLLFYGHAQKILSFEYADPEKFDPEKIAERIVEHIDLLLLIGKKRDG